MSFQVIPDSAVDDIYAYIQHVMPREVIIQALVDDFSLSATDHQRVDFSVDEFQSLLSELGSQSLADICYETTISQGVYDYQRQAFSISSRAVDFYRTDDLIDFRLTKTLCELIPSQETVPSDEVRAQISQAKQDLKLGHRAVKIAVGDTLIHIQPGKRTQIARVTGEPLSMHHIDRLAVESCIRHWQQTIKELISAHYDEGLSR